MSPPEEAEIAGVPPPEEAEIAGVPPPEEAEIAGVPSPEAELAGVPPPEEAEIDNAEVAEDTDDEEMEENAGENADEELEEIAGVPIAAAGVPPAEEADEMDRKYGGRTDGHLHSLTHSDTSNGEESLATPQMSMKRGLKEIGADSVNCMIWPL